MTSAGLFMGLNPSRLLSLLLNMDLSPFILLLAPRVLRLSIPDPSKTGSTTRKWMDVCVLLSVFFSLAFARSNPATGISDLAVVTTI